MFNIIYVHFFFLFMFFFIVVYLVIRCQVMQMFLLRILFS